MFTEQDFDIFMRALSFAACKHQNQRRKGRARLPYIHHPIRVAEILWCVGAVRDMPTLVTALLHDTLEDTETSAGELETLFGAEILALVLEVTDDKSLPQATRKQLQIEHAPHLSTKARLVKLADKINNVDDVSHDPPEDWTLKRRLEYLDWAEAVVAGLRGVNPSLEAYFDAVVRKGREMLTEKKSP
ncbi:MAG TPA: HD domain-containing protein [Anaerolineae bacterium]|nr:HD domain-containing protein [Anaerolineae bacterium]HQH37302.1 HD domain-containing protein [Anaerolineae bacterium]